jgi:glyoxylase-like metal-dependent hydrolase (beta-lactamase superfamily II)
MKKICLATALIIFSTQTAIAAYLDGFNADKVSDHVYVIHGPLELPNETNEGFMNNPAFIVTDDGVVVIDPGSSVHTGNMLLREIRKLTDKPVIAVFDTHVHGDHWLGNDAIKRAFPDADIYAHHKTISMIADGEGQNWLELMSTMTKGATDGTSIVNAKDALKGGEDLSIGGHQFQIIHRGKAHTVTDIMILYKEDNVLFTGDNVTHERIIRMVDGSFKGNIETIETAKSLQARIIVPGHGKTGGTELLDKYHTYLSTLYSSVSKYFDEDMSDFEMKPLIHTELKDFHHWAGYDDELGKHISGAYLEIEAAAF